MTISYPSDPAYSFTQPICGACWIPWSIGSRGNYFEPVRTKSEFTESETCCMCDSVTTDGIYIRIDPKIAPFPTNTK